MRSRVLGVTVPASTPLSTMDTAVVEVRARRATSVSRAVAFTQNPFGAGHPAHDTRRRYGHSTGPGSRPARASGHRGDCRPSPGSARLGGREITLPLELVSGQNAGFVIPDEAVAELGGGGHPKVVATVGEGEVRTSIARMGGRYLLGVNKANRAATGVQVGQEYTVRIALGEQERTVEIPPDLAEAFGDEPTAEHAWQSWSYTRRRQAAEALTGAKQEATRERRLAKLLQELRR